MSKMVDLAGERFGSLVAIKTAGSSKGRKKLWLCKCDCGNETIISGDCLRRGGALSCGCKKGELISKAKTKHGLVKTRLYRIWSDIKSRCYNRNEVAYKWYGARGISMCNEWLNDVAAFYTWAVKNGYHEGLTIDRIDNDGDYSPQNCRWVDMLTQCQNRRNNCYYTYNGNAHTIREWSLITGLSYRTIYTRIHKFKWDIERTLTTPKIQCRDKSNSRVITYKGKSLCIAEWARELGIKDSTLRERLRHGWDIKKAFNKSVPRRAHD